jgi:peptidoglycan/xylan/chitin deacetylase (PgdA/CDA1 family)
MRRVIDQAAGKDPMVVLMQSWPKTTPTALRELISHSKKEGAAFVTVAELTADERAALPTARP